jgi:hypothetical protein
VLHDLLYSGPSVDTLGDEYAKSGKLDRKAPIVTVRETLVDAPVATVWDLISHPTTWPSFDPAISDVWVGQASGSKVVHRNLLEQQPDGRTRVVSEESMAGVLVTLLLQQGEARPGAGRLARRAQDRE